MKSERRHELEKNELADWLGGTIKQIKPYQNLILGTVIFALVVMLIYTWSARYSAARTAEGWSEFNEAFALGASGADFEDIVEEHPNSDLGHWAAVIAADSYLNSGSELLFLNKADAYRDLKRAVRHYENVLEKSRQSMVRERATWGLARARESMASDAKDIEVAAKEYEKVFTNWPDGAFAKASLQRFESLSQGSAVEVYERFAKYEPKPAFEDEPGIPGQRPAFDIDALPDDGPLYTPSVNLDGPSIVVPGAEDEPGDGDMPPAADAPPAVEPEDAESGDAEPVAPADMDPPTTDPPTTDPTPVDPAAEDES